MADGTIESNSLMPDPHQPQNSETISHFLAAQRSQPYFE
jgi:hypothetical protein